MYLFINQTSRLKNTMNEWIEAKFKYGVAGSVASQFLCPSTIVGIDLPDPFFWIPSLDAMLIFVPNRTRHHWHYSDPNTVQRVGNLSRSMASRILNYAKTALLLLGPSVGNPHEQLGRPQPPSVTHRAITAHFSPIFYWSKIQIFLKKIQ